MIDRDDGAGEMSGEEESFRQFVLQRGPALSRSAYLLTGDHAAAEDLLQETLIRTASRWSRVVAAGEPERWVRKVMLNRLRSWRRPRRLRIVILSDLPERPTHDETDRAEPRFDLQRALAVLSPRQRAVLYLRFYEDLSEAETARQLDCSIGSVKRHSHDAVTRLRAVAPRPLAPHSPEVNAHEDHARRLP